MPWHLILRGSGGEERNHGPYVFVHGKDRIWRRALYGRADRRSFEVVGPRDARQAAGWRRSTACEF